MDINVRVAGEAGQGVLTTGNLLVGALAGLGLHVLSSQSYMSRIRGGLNWFDVRIADEELFSPRRTADLLVALTPPARDILAEDLTEGGMLLFDGAGGDGAVGIEFSRAAQEAAGSKLMANTVAAGAVFAVLGYDCGRLCGYLATQFKKKGDEVVAANVTCARRGAELAGTHAGRIPAPAPAAAPDYLCSGAEAIGLAAAAAPSPIWPPWPTGTASSWSRPRTRSPP